MKSERIFASVTHNMKLYLGFKTCEEYLSKMWRKALNTKKDTERVCIRKTVFGEVQIVIEKIKEN